MKKIILTSFILAASSQAFFGPRVLNTPPNTADICTNFTGTWKGVCTVGNGNADTATVNISQFGCQSYGQSTDRYYLGESTFSYIGGTSETIYSTPPITSNGITAAYTESHITSIFWSGPGKDLKTQLMIKTTAQVRTLSSESTPGVREIDENSRTLKLENGKLILEGTDRLAGKVSCILTK